VTLVRALGQHEATLVALTDLAFALVGMGDYAASEECLAEARELCNAEQEPGQVALTLALSASVALRCGIRDRAADYANRAAELIEGSSSPLRRAKVGNTLGRLRCDQRDAASALRLHTAAHEIAAKVGYRIEEAYALSGMARAADELGEDRAAGRWRAAAEELFLDLGVPASRRRSAPSGGFDVYPAGPEHIPAQRSRPRALAPEADRV
jgi:tetratricopeptide (TPR) repeat protein